MGRKINISLASTTSKPGQVESNLKQIADFAERASGEGMHVLLTPELSASGYGNYEEVFAVKEVAGQGLIYENLAKIAEQNKLAVLAGFPEQQEDKCFLSHYVVFPNGDCIVQRKHRVTPSEQPFAACVQLAGNDDGIGQPAEFSFQIFHIQDVRCAIVICADAGIEGVNEYLAEKEVDLMLLPTGAGGKREDLVSTSELYQEEGMTKYTESLKQVFFPGDGPEKCIKYRRALAAVNLCGYDGKVQYHRGHGMIINPMGEVQGFFHGIPNLDRQRPMYSSAIVDIDDRLT